MEYLIASSLGLMLLFIIITLYASNQRSYQQTQAVARLQETGLFVSQFLREKIQTAGYLGCARLSQKFPLFNASQKIFSSDSVLRDVRYDDEAKIMSYQIDDAIVVRQADSTIFPIVQANTHSVGILNSDNISEHDLIVISDCEHAEIVEVNRMSKDNNISWLELNTALNAQYHPQGQVSLLSTYKIYVNDTKRKNSAGDPIYALFYENLYQPTQPKEMIDGVEKIKITYGITGAVSDYKQAEQVSDWSSIRYVRVELLLNTVEPASSEIESYQFQNKTILPHDHLLRQAWTVIIALRERFT